MKEEALKKALALTLCLLLAALAPLSAMESFHHALHEHAEDSLHGDCPLCVMFAAAGNLLKLLAGVAAAAAFGYSEYAKSRSAVKALDVHTPFITLVRLKIKFNA